MPVPRLWPRRKPVPRCWTVSYTHLDVYKRQLRVSTEVGNSASAPISSPVPITQTPEAKALDLLQKEHQPYCYPSLNLFNANRPEDESGAVREMKRNADVLVNTLDSFGVKTKILDICRGPSVTRYELQPQAGIKVSRITSLADDIALNLACLLYTSYRCSS